MTNSGHIRRAGCPEFPYPATDLKRHHDRIPRAYSRPSPHTESACSAPPRGGGRLILGLAPKRKDFSGGYRGRGRRGWISVCKTGELISPTRGMDLLVSYDGWLRGCRAAVAGGMIAEPVPSLRQTMSGFPPTTPSHFGRTRDLFLMCNTARMPETAREAGVPADRHHVRGACHTPSYHMAEATETQVPFQRTGTLFRAHLQ